MLMKKYNLIFTSCLIAILTACGGKQEAKQADRMVRVKAVNITSTGVVIPVYATGRLSSSTEIKLSFKTGGVIEAIPVMEGQKVQTGDILARLDLAEINAQAGQADLALKKAERDFIRIQNLYNDSVATLENLQDAKTALDVARANYDISSFNLEYSVIRSPFRGRVLKKLAEENEIIGPGHPVIILSSTEADWVLKANITDRDIVKLSIGDSARVVFDAHPGTIFKSEIVELGHIADPFTGTYEIELRISPENRKLVSGFVGKAEIFPLGTVDCLQIPVDALFDASGLSAYVYVLDGNMVSRRRVELLSVSDPVCVISGLSDGEKIITEGMNYLNDGDEVVVIN